MVRKGPVAWRGPYNIENLIASVLSSGEMNMSSGPQTVLKVPWCVCVRLLLSECVTCDSVSVCVCVCSQKRAEQEVLSPQCMEDVPRGFHLHFFLPLPYILSASPASLRPQS